MKRVIFKNGLTFIYKHVENNLTSFSIAFEAGANLEKKEEEYGLAHMVEHMVFKGTKTYSELQINQKLDRIFGFNNAMTNYPYVVYYGTLLSQDFEEGFKLYSDIILNPIFPKEGFKEEVEVILEELKEWKEDTYQACEDELFYNAFNTRRIKELIIGNENSIKNISLDMMKEFYNKYYTPDNCVISVVSSLDFEHVFKIVKNIFSSWNKKLEIQHPYIIGEDSLIYENNKVGLFKKEVSGLQGAKIQFLYPIHELNKEEIKALRIFNVAFGEGTSSFLYDEIRTKKGFSYEVGSIIKNEKGIKIFKIFLGTSKNKVLDAINIIKDKIEEIKNNEEIFTSEKILQLSKSLELKRSIALEKSIQQSVSLAVYEIMYGDFREISVEKNYELYKYFSPLYTETRKLEQIDGKFINKVIQKVFKEPTIEILE